MPDYLDELISYWNRNKVEVAPHKATAQEIDAWELRYNVVLPADLRDYVMRVNGILDGEKLEFDNDCFSFLPLSAMCPEGVWSESVLSSNLFVFADYLIQCYWWCAVLDKVPKKHTQILLSGGRKGSTRLVANSLSEFFDLYRNDQSRLHWG